MVIFLFILGAAIVIGWWIAIMAVAGWAAWQKWRRR